MLTLLVLMKKIWSTKSFSTSRW